MNLNKQISSTQEMGKGERGIKVSLAFLPKHKFGEAGGKDAHEVEKNSSEPIAHDLIKSILLWWFGSLIFLMTAF